MPSKNEGRLAQDMKRELIGIIDKMKDPRLGQGLVTITRVDVTQDLDLARVYVSEMGRPEDAEPVVKVLQGAAGHIRTEISRRMHIRKAPRLEFVTDAGAAYAAHINEILTGLDIPSDSDGEKTE